MSPDFHSWLNMCMKERILIMVRSESCWGYYWMSLCVLMVAMMLLCVLVSDCVEELFHYMYIG